MAKSVVDVAVQASQVPEAELEVNSPASAPIEPWRARYLRLKRSKWYPLTPVAFAGLCNCVCWVVAAAVLSRPPHPSRDSLTAESDLQQQGKLLAAAALAYSYGLRHALDADHITAIDNLTRALVNRAVEEAATKQAANNNGTATLVEPAHNPIDEDKPVTVGLFFSLGHSSVVIVATAVVACASRKIVDGFGAFRDGAGGIVGTAVSMTFLLLIGALNAVGLVTGIRRLHTLSKTRRILLHAIKTNTPPEPHLLPAPTHIHDNHLGNGLIYRLCQRLFKLIDRPWKMYPLGILFGLGFDTSTEVALLAMASVQESSSDGTPLGYVMFFPVLFTCGMMLVDTIDGALMYAAYRQAEPASHKADQLDFDYSTANTTDLSKTKRKVDGVIARSFYSTVLAAMSVSVAAVVGSIQLLNLIANTSDVHGRFWDGVSEVSDKFDLVGGLIVASFLAVIIIAAAAHYLLRRRERRRDQALQLAAVSGST
ncbi:hypothetical protein PYCC9005_001512 [Savitreella phatthalungensis]